METIAITSQAPVMPAAWPQSEHIRPVKRRLPNTVDEPKISATIWNLCVILQADRTGRMS